MSRIHGLYAITAGEPDTNLLVRKVHAALKGGARVVQYRDKSTDKSLRLEQAVALNELCRAADAALIINDDVSLALDAGAAGVHLGEEDGDIAEARRLLGPSRLLGASCYNQIALAGRAIEAGADHVAFGSVFSSPTKPAARRAPLTLYTEARRQLAVPVVAIGGITVENAPQVIAAGAGAIAVITALFDAPDIEARAREFAALFR